MAKSKTPAKRIRQAEKNRIQNKAYKSKIKTAERNFLASVTENDTEAASTNLIDVISLVDKSVSKGIMHKNTAARKKSSLNKTFNDIQK